MILGIDEVGRGAWAGPLVIGAVVLLGQSKTPGMGEVERKLIQSASGFLGRQMGQ